MPTHLSGLVVVRNAITLDYCVDIAAQSLLPVCDQVHIFDMESDDGTWELLKLLERTSGKIILHTQRWDNPHNDPQWWVKALNKAREQLPAGWLLQLDADEVLGEKCADGIRLAMEDNRPAFFRRHNFWRDPQHLAPENRVCGTMVARLGPANLYLPSDEPDPAVHPNIRTYADYFSNLEIYHYGFLRKPDAFVRKTHVVQNAFFGSVDSRIEEAQRENRRWDERDYFDGLPLRDYIGKHPAVARNWLIERGYKL